MQNNNKQIFCEEYIRIAVISSLWSRIPACGGCMSTSKEIMMLLKAFFDGELFDKNIFDKCLFGNFKGAMIYMQMGGMLHEITVHEINEGYIDYITTDDNHRGKGIATRLIKYVCDTLSYESYTLDVLSKNTTAKRLYEYLGFVQTHIKKNPLIMLGGFGNQIVMKLEVDIDTKGN